MSLTIELAALQEFILNKVNDVPIETKQQVIAVMNREFIVSDNPDIKIHLSEDAWLQFLMLHTQEWEDPAGVGHIVYCTARLFP